MHAFLEAYVKLERLNDYAKKQYLQSYEKLMNLDEYIEKKDVEQECRRKNDKSEGENNRKLIVKSINATAFGFFGETTHKIE